MKWHVQRTWNADKHFVWCSPTFDPARLGAEDHGSLIPDTSSPANIYRDLARACKNPDRHNAKIVEARAKLTERVAIWLSQDVIGQLEADDILHLLKLDDKHHWRPLLYVIPTASIDPSRIKVVPMKDRAGVGVEYQIHDLDGSEFDRIEFNAS